MFLLQSFLVLAVCYAWSAVLGEVLYPSARERELPAFVRAGLGFFASFLWFSAAWPWMSLAQTWGLGLILVAAVAIVPALRLGVAGSLAAIGAAARGHARPFIACMAAGLVFFAPLIAGGKFGPFTEGGGDITIYADGTRYLTSQGLTSRGEKPPSSLGEVFAAMTDSALLGFDHSRLVARGGGLDERQQVAANPPSANSAVVRIMVAQTIPPTPYSVFGEYEFLASDTNYHVYFGIQAFVYALILACAFFALPAAPPRVRWLLTALAMMSHSLVSVFYNMYAGHGLAIATSGLIAVLVWRVRPFSAAGVRTYGTTLSYLFIGYVHYVSIGAPLVLAALALPREPGSTRTKPASSPGSFARLPLWAAGAIAVPLYLVMVGLAAQGSIAFVIGLMRGRLRGETNLFLGEQLTMFSLHWTSFLFGAVSQQHFRPFAFMSEWVTGVVGASVAFGLVALLFGLLLVTRAAREPGRMPPAERRFHIVLYALMWITIAFHIYWAQTYAYTQAKGAQNTLFVFYTALCLPLAFAYGHFENAGRRRDVRIVWWALVLLAVALAVVRGVYGRKIALEYDRSGILDRSFFSEAERVRERDPESFVLFEPRKSADLYVSIQPFADSRMVPIRHLGVLWIDWKAEPPALRKVDPAELIHDQDLPHLWVLRYSMQQGRWLAERLAEEKKPRVVITADDYMFDQSRRPRSADPRDIGSFSYVRTGTTSLLLPAGSATEVEVRASAREQQTRLEKQVAEGVKASRVPMRQDNEAKWTVLRLTLPARESAIFVPLLRYTGEYFVNVRVDGKDVRLEGGTEAVSGRISMRANGELSVTAHWSGIVSPDKQDWVGLFPIGGDDNTRMGAPKFLEGRESGTATFSVPGNEARALPPYEIRLYRAGTWELLGTSEPLSVESAAKTP